MKIVLCERMLYNVGLGLLLALNYIVEGFLMYGVYLLIDSWIVTGQETLWWIFWVLFFMFIRLVATAEHLVKFDFHYYTIGRVIATIGYSIAWLIKKIPISVEVRDD